MGLETEYGLAPFRRRQPAPDETPAGALVAEAKRRHPFMPACRGGIFLGNAARLYVDAGGHPELATPEVSDPADVVAYAAAGDDLLYELACRIAEAGEESARPLLFRCNVDYKTRRSWGCHENYAHRTDPARLPAELIPHFVSRIIYTGAGGFNPFAPGIEFSLSPRTHFLSTVVSPNSIQRRGIFHTKEEPLALPGWHRLHVLCGESLCGHLGNYLRVGTTASILALVEAGFSVEKSIRLRSPLASLRRFASDPELQATAETEDGRQLTALEIQREYLRFVECHADSKRLPPWTGRMCDLWRDTLGRLSGGWAAVSSRLDWAAKWKLYTTHCRRRGLPGEVMASRASARSGGAPDKEKGPANKSETEARRELCELEIRWGQLGPRGIFACLEQAGFMEHHRLPEITPGRVQAAITEPPGSGRARLRGTIVRELRARPGCECDWHRISNDRGEWLDLSDPEQAEMPEWKRTTFWRTPVAAAEYPGLAPPRRSMVEPRPTRPLHPESYPGAQAEFDVALDPGTEIANGTATAGVLLVARQLFERGHYDRAVRILREMELVATGELRTGILEMLVVAHARRGFFSTAFESLGRCMRNELDALRLRILIVILHRFRGLVPDSRIWASLRQGDEIIGQQAGISPIERFAFRVHKAAAHLHAGQPAESRSLLIDSLAVCEAEEQSPLIRAQAQAILAETHRRLGEPAEAHRLLEQASEVQNRCGFLGDFAEFTLACEAKLAAHPHALQRALSIQYSTGHRMGLARTLCLKARLDPGTTDDDRCKAELEQLQTTIPSLGTCPLFGRILGNWDAWCGGGQLSGESDRFWGL